MYIGLHLRTSTNLFFNYGQLSESLRQPIFKPYASQMYIPHKFKCNTTLHTTLSVTIHLLSIYKTIT